MLFLLLPSGILVCTDVMARGIDIPEVHWVLQYDPPSSARYNFRSQESLLVVMLACCSEINWEHTAAENTFNCCLEVSLSEHTK